MLREKSLGFAWAWFCFERAWKDWICSTFYQNRTCWCQKFNRNRKQTPPRLAPGLSTSRSDNKPVKGTMRHSNFQADRLRSVVVSSFLSQNQQLSFRTTDPSLFSIAKRPARKLLSENFRDDCSSEHFWLWILFSHALGPVPRSYIFWYIVNVWHHKK